jgi:hypothetical protein
MKHEGWYGYVYPKSVTQFTRQKILTPSIANAAAYALDMRGECYFVGSGGGGGGGYGIVLKEGTGLSYQFVLGLLNSKIADFVLKRISTPFRGGYFAYSRQFIEPTPIPVSAEAQRRAIESLVGYLHWLHTQPSVLESKRENPVDPDIAAYIEQWANALVYELYFPAEIRAAGLRFYELTESLKLPTLDSLPTAAADRLERFRKLHKEWSGQGHRLRIALDKLRTLDLVRTIEEK